MLDEIDKLGHDFRGDPAAALLEVLDPEQNHTLLGSLPRGAVRPVARCMFVATANIIDPIPPALRDRLEVLELPGYTREEKLQHREAVPGPEAARGARPVDRDRSMFDDAAVAEVDRQLHARGRRP